MPATNLLILGTRPRWGRLVGIATGVAVGVVLALMLVAGSNALEARDIRSSWVTPSLTGIEDAAADESIAAPADDIFEGDRIKRLDLAVPAGSTVTIPGLPAPKPGTYVASPALAKLIADAPAPALGDRYGTPAGTIPAELLSSPDSLVVVVGGTREQVAGLSSAGVVESFGGDAYGGNQNYQTLALVGALALLIPAFLLVGVSTTLGAAARAERSQTLRIIGASRRFVRRLAIVEATGTAVVGALLGVAAFFALRPVLALLPVAGERLVASDLTVPTVSVVVLVAAVILGSMLAAGRSARRAESNPATAQAVFEEAPGPVRLVPLLAGLGAFGLINVFSAAIPIPLAIPVVASFGAIAVGLLIAGPYFTWVAGKVLARYANSGETLIASRRILTTPRAGFRSVAGLVTATFLVTVFAFSASALVSADAYTKDALLPDDAVAAHTDTGANLEESATEERLRDVPGAEKVYFTRTDGDGIFIGGQDATALTGRSFDGDVGEIVGGVFTLAPDGAPLIARKSVDLTGMRVGDVIVRTDGKPESIEEARTALLSLPGVDRAAGAWTRAEYITDTDSDLATQFTEIGRAAIAIVTALAAAVLTIATIAALYDRKRIISLLQLIGMPSGSLRRVISWETLLPLLSIQLPTIGIGWFTAWMLITTLSSRTLSWPDPLLGMALIAAAGMAALSILIASGVGATISRAPENTRRE